MPRRARETRALGDDEAQADVALRLHAVGMLELDQLVGGLDVGELRPGALGHGEIDGNLELLSEVGVRLFVEGEVGGAGALPAERSRRNRRQRQRFCFAMTSGISPTRNHRVRWLSTPIGGAQPRSSIEAIKHPRVGLRVRARPNVGGRLATPHLRAWWRAFSNPSVQWRLSTAKEVPRTDAARHPAHRHHRRGALPRLRLRRDRPAPPHLAAGRLPAGRRRARARTRRASSPTSRWRSELAEIGVILLMFGVGLHFSLKDLLVGAADRRARRHRADRRGDAARHRAGAIRSAGRSAPASSSASRCPSPAPSCCCARCRSGASSTPSAGASPSAG